MVLSFQYNPPTVCSRTSESHPTSLLVRPMLSSHTDHHLVRGGVFDSSDSSLPRPWLPRRQRFLNLLRCLASFCKNSANTSEALESSSIGNQVDSCGGYPFHLTRYRFLRPFPFVRVMASTSNSSSPVTSSVNAGPGSTSRTNSSERLNSRSFPTWNV